ncbi:MAG: leucine-rich repeat domain-containing protein, partial [Kiritimatiellaeota bacterium]|nr:leucine-rich repeat domain-containing protein [Kiritimatiellota bacterium]
FVFYSCGSLTEITLPASVTTLGYGVFDYSHVTSVYMLGNAPFNASANLYINSENTLTTYVLQGSTGWGVAIPGTWRNRPIAYFTPPATETQNGIPYDWLETHYPDDPRGYEALSVMNGANGVPMLDCYIADLVPTNPASLFVITHFSVTNNVPYFRWEPANRPGRVYTILGKETLADSVWLPTNQVPDAVFFRIGVKLE